MSLINLHRQSQEKWNYRPSCFEAQLSRRAFVEKRLKVVQYIFVSFRFSYFWLQKKKQNPQNRNSVQTRHRRWRRRRWKKIPEFERSFPGILSVEDEVIISSGIFANRETVGWLLKPLWLCVEWYFSVVGLPLQLVEAINLLALAEPLQSCQ